MYLVTGKVRVPGSGGMTWVVLVARAGVEHAAGVRAGAGAGRGKEDFKAVRSGQRWEMHFMIHTDLNAELQTGNLLARL